ncbi:uncharacterized protein LOC100167649 isoform X2 [Acyrthosiphon pisum]|nr:uncharacterized protein LOC100167649 isoform X2 [Acyrthosiphon pisum]XP_008186740.1 uncharacterized protein LOC100167649 isoform X2 [Acyrthosiphon pisum]XP_029344800.1 uncharacterized protein LOC100167649 isoform X2 [Acyrthosiphon pisum]XP_029344801.1 uncharacterized protein LOC100167649 isoform X2 [Acyrthosiphon pisum]|eukprot:XP_008186739.1 PREDICTED: uncharacterized protein LOC100167649 isoform X1 [Acyrthosiphon pisum]
MQKNLIDQSKMNERIKSIITHLRHNTFFNDNYFPLNNDVDLVYMENKILIKTADPEFKSLLVDDLIYFFGGRDAKDMVTRLMTKLFAMTLLSGFTLEGYKNKSRSFSNLNIYKVIFEAVQKKFENTAEGDIKQAIRDHLKKLPRLSV